MGVTGQRRSTHSSCELSASKDAASPTHNPPIRVPEAREPRSLLLTRAKELTGSVVPPAIQKTIEPKSVHILRLAVPREVRRKPDRCECKAIDAPTGSRMILLSRVVG